MDVKPMNVKPHPSGWVVISAMLLAISTAIATTGLHDAFGVSEFWRPVISGAIVGATTTVFLFYNVRQLRKPQQ